MTSWATWTWRCANDASGAQRPDPKQYVYGAWNRPLADDCDDVSFD
jgi:hypothetical protein